MYVFPSLSPAGVLNILVRVGRMEHVSIRSSSVDILIFHICRSRFETVSFRGRLSAWAFLRGSTDSVRHMAVRLTLTSKRSLRAHLNHFTLMRGPSSILMLQIQNK